jgi:hypothetical protein
VQVVNKARMNKKHHVMMVNGLTLPLSVVCGIRDCKKYFWMLAAMLTSKTSFHLLAVTHASLAHFMKGLPLGHTDIWYD